jgi:hypothetical protein
VTAKLRHTLGDLGGRHQRWLQLRAVIIGLAACDEEPEFVIRLSGQRGTEGVAVGLLRPPML